MNHRDTEILTEVRGVVDKVCLRLFRRPHALIFFSLCLCASVVNLSCGSKPTDLRTLVPAETLVYLETNDLGAALQPIVDSKPFNEVAKKKPDLSALKGVQLAVAITGFETSEEKLTDEHSVGKIQPHFVAVADTHAWHFQSVSFAESKIGAFVAQMYDSEPTLEKPEKNGGRYLTWTAQDGRKAYAFVVGSIIYFTNDETAIDKCLAVSRGESDSIVKTGKVQPADPTTLASGYITTDGVAQIANLAALKVASDASDESEVQSAIAGIIPGLIRGSVTDVAWTQTKTNTGIEDKWQVNMPPEIARVFTETMAATGKPDLSLIGIRPNPPSTVTLYDLEKPEVAWHSILLVSEKVADPVTARVLQRVMSGFFEPYGIRDGGLFLSGTGPTIVTKSFQSDGEDRLVVSAHLRDEAKSLGALLSPVNPKTISVPDGRMDVLQSKDGDLSAQINDSSILLAETDAFLGSVAQDRGGEKAEQYFDMKTAGTASTANTIGWERESTSPIVDFLDERKSENGDTTTMYSIQTRFNRSGMERRTTSDFGFIGWIIAQLDEN